MLLSDPILGCCGIKIEAGSGAAYAFTTLYEKRNRVFIRKVHWEYSEDELVGID